MSSNYRQGIRGTTTRSVAKAARSKAQTARDRQQRGVANSLAVEAERLFPALHSGVFRPEQLVRQARYVLDMAQLQTERHQEGVISGEHASKMARSIEMFAAALTSIGVMVPGLLHIKQRHYLDVIRHWENHPPGEARKIGWISSHLRRIFVPIGRHDVVPRGTKRLELFRQSGLRLGGKDAFLVNTYVDWRAETLDALAVFRAITDPGRSIAARMMYHWGMSLGEVARWTAVDPANTVALQISDLDGRHCARQAEFSLDLAVRVDQLEVLRDAWQHCCERGRETLRASHETPEAYAEHLRAVIRYAFSKVLKRDKIKPMQLRHAFFCQVFLDHSGLTLKEAARDQSLSASSASLARAWNEAKRQMGIKGAKAAHANVGLTVKQRRSANLALQLRDCSDRLGALGVAQAWVGELDASLGTCVVVSLEEGTEPAALPRIQHLLERCVPVKLRVLEHAAAGAISPDFSPVLMRRRLAV